MKKVTLFILLLTCCTQGFAQPFYKVKKTIKDAELYGYADHSGNVKIPCQYSWAFTDTLKTIAFVVDKRQEWIAINPKGKKLFQVYSYDNGPDYISDGLFRMMKNKKIGYADQNGNIVIPPQFFAASPFKNQMAKVTYVGKKKKKGEYTTVINGKWGLINTKGESLLPCVYDEIIFEKNGNIKLTYKNKSFRIKIEQ